MGADNSRSRLRSGFTLVELLIVLAIVGVLAGLLFPVIASIRERARQGVCTSNLRQLGHAYQMYVDTYGHRPRLFQHLAEGAVTGGRGILICPSDPEGNWGGLIHAIARETGLPTESVAYSYVHPFEWPDIQWNALMNAEGSVGVLACQVHGTRLLPVRPSLGAFEGLILRLQRDGAVVRRHVQWQRGPGTFMWANSWWLFTEAPEPDFFGPAGGGA